MIGLHFRDASDLQSTVETCSSKLNSHTQVLAEKYSIAWTPRWPSVLCHLEVEAANAYIGEDKSASNAEFSIREILTNAQFCW